MTIVKICGITDVENGLVAIDAGADYLGFIFYPPSFRFLTVSGAVDLITRLRAGRPTGWQAVGVFVNEPIERVHGVQRVCALDVVQLNGEEDEEYIRRIDGPVFKSVRFSETMSERSALFSPQPSPHWGEGTGWPHPSPHPEGAIVATRILLDANVPGMYGGTGVTYDWSKVRTAVADGFLAGGLSPDNVMTALEAAQPWGVDVSSGVERERRKDPALIQAFLAAVRQFDQSQSAKPERIGVI